MTDVDMAVSGMITFGLLIVIIDCLNGQNIPIHPEAVIIRLKDRSAIITCNVESSTLQSNVVHWYRVQPGGAFQRLIYFEAGAKTHTIDPEAPRNFAGSVRNQQVTITIPKVHLKDEGWYFCALWNDNGLIKRFGTGTRLIVTDQGKDTTKSPTLTAYLPTTKESGKQTRICQATDMFPDLVKFNWKKKSNTGDWTDVSEDNVVEQRNVDPVIVTSILIVDQYTAGEDLYQCTLTYEGGMKQKTLQNDKDPANNNEGATVKPTCSPDNKTSTIQISGSSDQIPSLYLFVYAYGVMLMKNGVYFCAVLIVLLKRKVGNKKESA
ncbi:uncharacterized protein LOC120482985 isoform X2 [Pimephales promelas]|uniref:uncharacterized protein LOC120482985 isoform X2 n=1 Tax=Pimephales promelas TaxID=90988 RepID=UPI001955C57C|nr:uncharacterized protein LOC120482985 isoform X2 [Pimephales promelas]